MKGKCDNIMFYFSRIVAYCPALSIPVTVSALPDLADQLVPIGTTMTFSCRDDMTPSGVQQLSCTDDGAWFPDGQVPNCIGRYTII